MMEHAAAVPSAALADVAYLSRSENRVLVLAALTEGPRSRGDLREETGVSRATLGRIVNEFEERNWAERATDGGYVATPAGQHVAAEFGPFVESIEAVRRLGETVEWVPTEELSIDLRHFSDATVKRPANNDPMEMIDYFTDLVRGATEFRALTHLAPPVPVTAAVQNGLGEDRLAATCVVTADLLEYLGERADRRDRWRECLDAGVEMFRYRADIPCNLFVIDGTVLLKRCRPEPVQEAYGVPIVSENDAVRSWARDLIERYRTDAEPVDVASFDDGSSVATD